MSVKHVGVRELRGDLAEKLKGSEPIVIERHGQVLGIYVPVQPVDRAKGRRRSTNSKPCSRGSLASDAE